MNFHDQIAVSHCRYSTQSPRIAEPLNSFATGAREFYVNHTEIGNESVEFDIYYIDADDKPVKMSELESHVIAWECVPVPEAAASVPEDDFSFNTSDEDTDDDEEEDFEPDSPGEDFEIIPEEPEGEDDDEPLLPFSHTLFLEHSVSKELIEELAQAHGVDHPAIIVNIYYRVGETKVMGCTFEGVLFNYNRIKGARGTRFTMMQTVQCTTAVTGLPFDDK